MNKKATIYVEVENYQKKYDGNCSLTSVRFSGFQILIPDIWRSAGGGLEVKATVAYLKEIIKCCALEEIEVYSRSLCRGTRMFAKKIAFVLKKELNEIIINENVKK